MDEIEERAEKLKEALKILREKVDHFEVILDIFMRTGK